MKIKSYILFLVVTFFLTSEQVWAIQLVHPPGSLSRDSSESQTPQPERSGEIDNIGPGGRTIMVDGQTYLFDPASVIMHSNNPSVPAEVRQLQKGSHIGFATKAEGTGNLERITEIWLLEGEDAK
ncbi:MAG: hypothetical protein ACYDBV_09535 [Nitrospiria bacterium]